MGRIRTIKPEFPQSESIGRLSRDARLLFVQMWTIADDEGRLRGASRMLASLLYPYDEDAPRLIDSWLTELEREENILRYQVAGQTYIQITNWLAHQKIDRPSKSKIPEFVKPREDSTKAREASTTDRDQGRDLGREEDQGQDHAAPARGPVPPDSADARIACELVGIFPIRNQEEIHRMMRAYSLDTGFSGEQCIAQMQTRWKEFNEAAPRLEWQYGSAYKFFTSGKWDDPRSWPWKEQGRDIYAEYLGKGV